jgi:hypothetical protein
VNRNPLPSVAQFATAPKPTMPFPQNTGVSGSAGTMGRGERSTNTYREGGILFAQTGQQAGTMVRESGNPYQIHIYGHSEGR